MAVPASRLLLLLLDVSSASRCEITKRLATSGEQSPREICRKTRSGSALPRDFEKETSVVRKITCAMLAVVIRAALCLLLAVRRDGGGERESRYHSASLSYTTVLSCDLCRKLSMTTTGRRSGCASR